MELSAEEKERIILEEKLRMETRKDFLKENFNRGNCGWRGGSNRCGCHRCGGGWLKILAIVLIIFAFCRFWHRPYFANPPYYYGYGSPAYPVPQMQAVPPTPK